MKELMEMTLQVEEGLPQNIAAGVLSAGLLLNPLQANAMSKIHHHHHGLAHKQYSHEDIINSIVGEEAQNYEGMVAVACVIRNRGKNPYYKHNILDGVYGRTAKHLKTESPETFDNAEKAWQESATNDITGGAIVWGYGPDLQKWEAEAQANPKFWFNNVEPTVKVGDNTFFKYKQHAHEAADYYSNDTNKPMSYEGLLRKWVYSERDPDTAQQLQAKIDAIFNRMRQHYSPRVAAINVDKALEDWSVKRLNKINKFDPQYKLDYNADDQHTQSNMGLTQE